VRQNISIEEMFLVEKENKEKEGARVPISPSRVHPQ
jgi:hypothetical protein